MFYYLDGTVAEILPGLAVIDCGGVGYACMTTNNTLSQLKKGEKKKLYTYLNVGESIFDLYGFATQNELNSFKLLLGVSGVGPKAALAILSANTPEGLAMAIVTGGRQVPDGGPGHRQKDRPADHFGVEGQNGEGDRLRTGLLRRKAARAVPAVFTSKATEAAAALAVLGYSSARGADGPQGRGCGESAVGGDHPPEPEENGEVMGNLHGLFYSVGAIAGITAAALAVLGYVHAEGADGPQGRGCGESAVGGDHPPEPEENGEVIGK